MPKRCVADRIQKKSRIQNAAIKTGRENLWDYAVDGSGDGNGWHGRPARSGRRPADRKREVNSNPASKIFKWMRPAIPSGGSPNGTGQWPVLPTADHFRQRHNPTKKLQFP